VWITKSELQAVSRLQFGSYYLIDAAAGQVTELGIVNVLTSIKAAVTFDYCLVVVNYYAREKQNRFIHKVTMSFLPVSNLMAAASGRNPVKPSSICSGRTKTLNIKDLYATRHGSRQHCFNPDADTIAKLSRIRTGISCPTTKRRYKNGSKR
jgi:hypothetical protein